MRWSLILGILISATCSGITLDEALETARRENRELALSRLSLRESTEKLHQSKSSFFPTVEFTSGYTRMSSIPVIQFGEGPGIPLGYYDNYSVAMNFSYPLFTFGKRKNAYELALLGVEMSKEDSLLKECDLRERVSTAFYGLLMAQEALKIAKEAVERAQDHLQTVDTQYKKGIVSQLDLLRAEYSYSKAEADYLRAKNSQETARRALNLILGIDIDEPTIAEGELEYRPFEKEIDRLIERAIERRPELRATKLAREMASINLNLTKFKNSPNLILALGYSNEKPYQFEERWGRSLVATLGVQFPLFDGFRNLSEIREARVKLRKAQIQEGLLQRVIQFEVEKAYSDLKESEAELAVQKKALAQAEEALRIAEEQYRRGLISSLDYRDTAFAYTQAQFSNLLTLYNYIVSRVKLERAVGAWD